MPVETTRRTTRRTTAKDDAGSNGARAAVHNPPSYDARSGGRSERFFADGHGVRPDPALVVGLDTAVADDTLLRSHWMVACADSHH